MGASGRVHVGIETPMIRREAGRFVLAATRPGVVRGLPALGTVVGAGETLGELEVLGTVLRIVVPSGAHGVVVGVGIGRSGEAVSATGMRAKWPVAYGTDLVALDPEVGGARAAGAALSDAETASTGLVFRTPLGGRYYARPSPDAEPFVKVGAEIEAGATIALVEVMKTFHRLRYGGEGLPDVARVVRVVPKEGDDIARCAAILEVEPGDGIKKSRNP